jgi:hypothetical protein
MASMAISVLWFLIGLIVLAGVIYLAIWVIEQFIFPIPEQVKKGVWVIVLLLALFRHMGAGEDFGDHHDPLSLIASRWTSWGSGASTITSFGGSRGTMLACATIRSASLLV